MNKTLIAFGTRYGATAKSSEVIAQVLKDEFNHEVEVVKLSSKTENVDIAIYDNVIVGTSLAMFSWTKRAKKFLKKDFSGKKLFVFISSAALTYPALEKGEIDKYRKWKNRFLDRVVKKNANIEPTSTAVFGGWIENRGKPGTYGTYNWKEEDMIKWAEEIGNLTS
ncbi:MAG: flavodoxin domain-containing protein [Candidatus Heimdallarchaeaceae archaeon]